MYKNICDDFVSNLLNLEMARTKYGFPLPSQRGREKAAAQELEENDAGPLFSDGFSSC